MSVTTEHVIAAEGARRLLDDPILQGFLEELRKMHTERAIGLVDPTEREASRQMVLAIGALKGSLEAAVDYVLGARQRDALDREMEDIV